MRAIWAQDHTLIRTSHSRIPPSSASRTHASHTLMCVLPRTQGNGADEVRGQDVVSRIMLGCRVVRWIREAARVKQVALMVA
eukprot:2768796-Rhodomonas_salina.2